MSKIVRQYEKAVEKFDKKWVGYESMDLDYHLLMFLKPRITKLIGVGKEYFDGTEDNYEFSSAMKELLSIIEILTNDGCELYSDDGDLNDKELTDRMFDLLKKHFRGLWY